MLLNLVYLVSLHLLFLVILYHSQYYHDTIQIPLTNTLTYTNNLTKMMLEEVTTEKIKKKEEVKDAQKSYMDWGKKTVYDRIIRY